MPDYSVLQAYSQIMFYPRRDITPCPENASDMMLEVAEDAQVHCRLYLGDKDWPWLIYFHGNGEVACDYDELAPVYNWIGLNVAVADYRGYGAGSGQPTFVSMLEDANAVFNFISTYLAVQEYNEELWVMGRSLGSLSALALAERYSQHLQGMIIESGFPDVTKVMRHLNHLPRDLDTDAFSRECLEQVRQINIPALIIHGEEDEIVPVEEAHFLFDNLASTDKKMLLIPEAGHNNLIAIGVNKYFKAIKEFTSAKEK